jgi:VWA domain-containing protein
MMRSILFGGLMAVLTTTAIATSAAGAPARSAQACVPYKNAEAIIDDSGSMLFNDSNRLRVQGLRLLMSTPGNESKTLGAIEFGSEANSIFAPASLRTNRTQFSALLDQQVQADNGGTDYNAAFNLAKTHNPNADRRIFLTDGAHNEDAYANGHVGGPGTDVIGLSAGITGTDEARLKQIARETGGIYRKADDAGELQAAMNDVNAAINCRQQPVDYTDTLRQGRSKAHRLKVPRGIRSVQFALSWSESVDKFDISRFRIVRKGKVVAKAARKVRRLKVTKRRGATFVTVKVSRVVRGRLSFRVRARKVRSSTFAGVQVVTQASRSKRR